MLLCSEFIEKNKLTIKSPYYYRAADAGDGIFTFSVPMSGGLYISLLTVSLYSVVVLVMVVVVVVVVVTVHKCQHVMGSHSASTTGSEG